MCVCVWALLTCFLMETNRYRMDRVSKVVAELKTKRKYHDRNINICNLTCQMSASIRLGAASNITVFSLVQTDRSIETYTQIREVLKAIGKALLNSCNCLS